MKCYHCPWAQVSATGEGREAGRQETNSSLDEPTRRMRHCADAIIESWTERFFDDPIIYDEGGEPLIPQSAFGFCVRGAIDDLAALYSSMAAENPDVQVLADLVSCDETFIPILTSMIIDQKRPYPTKYGYIGLVPAESTVGDKVCIVSGMKTPFCFAVPRRVRTSLLATLIYIA